MSAASAPAASAPSLERLLMWRLSLLYMGAFLVVSVGYLALAWSSRHVQLAEEMDGLTTELAQSVHLGHDGKPYLSPPLAQRHDLAKLARFGVAVIDARTGAVVAESARPQFPFTLRASDSDLPGFDGDFSFRGPDGTWRFGAVRTVNTPQGTFRVELLRRGADASDAADYLWDEVVTESLPTLAPLAVATVLITWLTVRGSLRPLHRLSEAAREVQGTAGSVRLETEGVPIEIRPVVDAANTALEGAEQMLHRQQRFMANVAHELRTPLAVLRARIDGIDEKARAALTTDIDRMARLIDQLLAVARLEAQAMPFDAVFELTAVVREALAQMAPLALAQGKDLALEAPESPIMVRGNAMELDHALRNLVDNALRFTPPGSAVEVAVDGNAVIEVRDHGPGVPPDLVDRIVEPFWRSDSNGGAAGLGLAIVAEVTRLHSGRLDVRNAPGGGAVFRIELPTQARL